MPRRVVDGPHPVDRHVGRRVAEKRISLGYNQSDLGRALGLTFQQVQKYEKGTNRIGASRLQAIADILGVHPSFFFQEDDKAELREAAADIHESQEISSFVASKEGIALNRAFLKIADPLLRKRIISLVAAMARTPEAEQAIPFEARHAESLHG